MTRTIQNVIDTIIAAVPGAPVPWSVDTLKRGNPADEVHGIVTTFTATCDVLEQAVALGADLIITHEPTFYDHRDETAWLARDSVYEAKDLFLKKHALAVWRFHDYWHFHTPDGIITGVVKAMGWEQNLDEEARYVVTLPPCTLTELVDLLKQKLALAQVRLVGDPAMSCQRIGLIVGAMGGDYQIKAFSQDALDVVVCGETVEWQTCEYVRDAIACGQKKALLILGHANSEEAGMKYLVEWLRPKLPDVPLFHVPAGDPVRVL